MNLYFTKTKRLMFDEHYNLLFDGDPTEEERKEISEFIQKRKQENKPLVKRTVLKKKKKIKV